MISNFLFMPLYIFKIFHNEQTVYGFVFVCECAMTQYFKCQFKEKTITIRMYSLTWQKF